MIQTQLGNQFQKRDDEYGQIMNSALSDFLTDMVSDVKVDRKISLQQSAQHNSLLRLTPTIPSSTNLMPERSHTFGMNKMRGTNAQSSIRDSIDGDGSNISRAFDDNWIKN